MKSPIINRIGAVFIPVSDMRAAVDWYSALLGLPVQHVSHEGRIYDLPMQGETAVILDAHKPVQNSSQPLLFFLTDDIRRSYEFLRERGVEVVTDVEDIGSVSMLIFKDPDNNLLMVAQRNRAG